MVPTPHAALKIEEDLTTDSCIIKSWTKRQWRAQEKLWALENILIENLTEKLEHQGKINSLMLNWSNSDENRNALFQM